MNSLSIALPRTPLCCDFPHMRLEISTSLFVPAQQAVLSDESMSVRYTRYTNIRCNVHHLMVSAGGQLLRQRLHGALQAVQQRAVARVLRLEHRHGLVQ